MMILTLLMLGFFPVPAISAAGSEKDVHYWFLPTESAVRVASDGEVFHEYRPQCIKITDEMHPCDKIQYKSMRMPNLLGQSTVQEAKSFLYSFGDESFLACDKYARDFLCSLATPLCFDGKPQFKIPPCRRLCERVRDKCFYQLYDAGFGIPGEFNCSKFEDNKLCMDPTTGLSTTPMPEMPWTRNPEVPEEEYDYSEDSEEAEMANEDDESDSENKKPAHPWVQPFLGTVLKPALMMLDDSHVREALCHSPPPHNESSTIIVRGRLKSIRKKRKGYYMKIKKKHMKVFYDEDLTLGELEGEPTYKGIAIDEYFFRTYEQLFPGGAVIPLKNDVVYFFVSRLEVEIANDVREEFFRVQYMVPDDGSAHLRSLMNIPKKLQIDCAEFEESSLD